MEESVIGRKVLDRTSEAEGTIFAETETRYKVLWSGLPWETPDMWVLKDSVEFVSRG